MQFSDPMTLKSYVGKLVLNQHLVVIGANNLYRLQVVAPGATLLNRF